MESTVISHIKKAVEIAGSQRDLAAKLQQLGCNASQSLVSKWIQGLCDPQCEHALAIEQITHGEVKAVSLFPHLSKLLPKNAA